MGAAIVKLLNFRPVQAKHHADFVPEAHRSHCEEGRCHECAPGRYLDQTGQEHLVAVRWKVRHHEHVCVRARGCALPKWLEQGLPAPTSCAACAVDKFTLNAGETSCIVPRVNQRWVCQAVPRASSATYLYAARQGKNL